MEISTTIKDRYTKVKTHLVENKKTYFACAGTAVTAVVGTIYILNNREESNPKVSQKWNFLPRSEFNEVTITLEELSTPSKPVHMKDQDGNDFYFRSLNQAARETGHSVAMISRQINGHSPDVHGDVFELLEPSAN